MGPFRLSRENKKSILITVSVLLAMAFIGLAVLIYLDYQACQRLPGTGQEITPYGDRIHEC